MAKKIIKSAKVSVCSQDKSFFVSDGSVYASLAELAKGLRKMHPDTFKYHANAEKNDFANWVKDVFGDQKLAKQALGAKDQKQLAKIVAAKLK
jgi:hypothetical protein